MVKQNKRFTRADWITYFVAAQPASMKEALLNIFWVMWSVSELTSVHAVRVSLWETTVTKTELCEMEQRYLQISVGMATKSNSSQYFKIVSTMLMSVQRKYRGRFFWNWLHSDSLHLRKGLCSCTVQFCGARLCLFLVLFPSSSVASSNQDIMKAKWGWISTLRAAGFSEHW